jgi:translation initiation factor 2A
MCATLAPRMNVDNGFKLFKYNGQGPVLHYDIEQAFDCMWRPSAPGIYPNRGPSPKREGDPDTTSGKGSAPAVAKVQAYRAPGSSGSSALSDMMRREGSATGKVKAGGAGTGGRQRIVPGMAAPTPSPAAAAVDPGELSISQCVILRCILILCAAAMIVLHTFHRITHTHYFSLHCTLLQMLY